ncbi:protease modulator HflC [Alkalicaulis satelles]|uniref:Protein HflC n=1 Tax=Alkalicaulis satelles TaxID=2609175 RepID=A0A5M6ZLK6_9PROT|nr:protease modulator HflC [Alkalicaulis satelles]KAA5804624.1 protease modulator HflC [Alkalicaulis satelles]
MRTVIYALIGVVILGVIVLMNSIYIVSERQQALVLRFGEPMAVVNAIVDPDEPRPSEAGLHFRTPFITTVTFFDKRNLEFDTPPSEILASDQERIVVDAFLRYRVVNPLRVFQTVRDETGLRQRLRSIMDDSVRGVIASLPSSEIISGQRADLMERIRVAVETQARNQDLGIEIIDARIKRADLPQQIANQVFERMRAERQQEAAQIRAEGEQRSREIRADADRQVEVILANARAESERIRGEGDGERNRIFAAAFNQDPDFFDFYRSMIAYETALRDGTPIIVPADSEFFRYFRSERGSPR